MKKFGKVSTELTLSDLLNVTGSFLQQNIKKLHLSVFTDKLMGFCLCFVVLKSNHGSLVLFTVTYNQLLRRPKYVKMFVLFFFLFFPPLLLSLFLAVKLY